MELKPYIILLLLIGLISSCSTPKNLPQLEEVPFSPNGSYIEIKQISGGELVGELIAADSKTLVILTTLRKIQNLPVSDIETFELTYAQPENYSWTIPVYTVASLSHGVFAIFTAPINVIVTSLVTMSGAKAFTYTEDIMNYEELSKFARFPQGIPPNIDPALIR